VFCSICTKLTKHKKNIEIHWKTQKTHNTLVYCGHFPRAKNRDCIAQNTVHKTSAKHRKKLQSSHKTRFAKLRRKTLQNARKTRLQKRHKTLTYTDAICIACIRCFLLKSVRSVAKAHNTQYSRVKYGGGGHAPAGGHVAGLWMFFKNSVCFAAIRLVLTSAY